ncbi:F-box/LRR-repeat protein 10-like isoform X3 [Durio zibethinus]|uniref:F-box/LRR-repeat protein 10-like isoform X3 n=1 Tax=Durio zibethinus TaxID=66656 RepID=A0A6P5XAG0_DURZI|nr:F-box/LRR-repeat protein 10-like isoform X3 [Durio zibethinus]
MASGSLESLDRLPTALLATIMTKLDVSSICSLAVTCRTFSSCASHILSFLPHFHILDISPTMELIKPLLPPNPHLKSLKLNCGQLSDSSIELLLRPSLQELCLHNCADFSGKLLSEIGSRCKDLRSLYLGSVAEKRGRAIHISDLEELLGGCTQLEALNLMFDISLFLRHNFARVWTLASEKLTSLEIGYISSVMVTELLSPNVGPHQCPNQIRPSVLPGIQKLSLSVDYITDTMINQHGRLKHLSLVRSQEFLITYFKRVNDLGILLMADKCANMESICLGGFCRVTDSGFKTILHSCSNLYKLKVSHGSQLTDLVFHDIAATSLSLTHVSLGWCNLLTNHAIRSLVCNLDLKVLDLRDCKNLGDEALRAIGSLCKLKMLLLDGSDITDVGMAYLQHGIIGSLVSLSVRGCKKLTDKCISALFDGSYKLQLQELDLSNLPNLSDNGVLTLAKHRVPIAELRMRQCPLIGDTSVMALASMQVDDDRGHGSSLQLLDLYNCGGITQLSFRWLKKPYFPRLRWLGVTGSVNRDIVDALARNRPFLHVACRGEEIGTDPWNDLDGSYMHDYEELDELERWLQEGEDESDDEEMDDADMLMG